MAQTACSCRCTPTSPVPQESSRTHLQEQRLAMHGNASPAASPCIDPCGSRQAGGHGRVADQRCWKKTPNKRQTMAIRCSPEDIPRRCAVCTTDCISGLFAKNQLSTARSFSRASKTWDYCKCVPDGNPPPLLKVLIADFRKNMRG